MDDRREELLSAYVDGELTPDERAEVERWLAESGEARQTVEELRALGGSLRHLSRHQLTADQSSSLIEHAQQARAAAGAYQSPASEPKLVPGGDVKEPAPRIDLRPGGGFESSTKLSEQVPANDLVQLRAANEPAPVEPWRLGRGGLRSLVWPLAALAAALLVMLFNREQTNEAPRQVAVAPPTGGELSARDNQPLAKANAAGGGADFDRADFNGADFNGADFNRAGADSALRKAPRAAETESLRQRGYLARSAKVAGSEAEDQRSPGIAAKRAGLPSTAKDQVTPPGESPAPNARGSRWSALSNKIANAPGTAPAQTDLYALEVNGIVKPVVQSFTCEVTPQFLHEQRFEKLLGDLKVEWQPAPADSPVLIYAASPDAAEPPVPLAYVAQQPAALSNDATESPLVAPLAIATPESQSYVIEATPEQLAAIVQELRRDRSAVANVSCEESPPAVSQYFALQMKPEGSVKVQRDAASAKPAEDTPAVPAAAPVATDQGKRAEQEKRIVRLRQAPPFDATQPSPPQPAMAQSNIVRNEETSPAATPPREPLSAAQPAPATQAPAARAPAAQSPAVVGQNRGGAAQNGMLRDARGNDDRAQARGVADAKEKDAQHTERPVVFFTLQPQSLPAPAAPTDQAPTPISPPLQKARAGGQP